MTPSPGAGGLGCLLVPLHLLTSYSLVRYFATPQHLENQQKKAQYSLANLVVHYEPVRRSLDPRNADEGGRAGGNEGDCRRRHDRARTVVAEEESTDDSARMQLVNSSTLANSPLSPAAAAIASANGNNAEVSRVADSQYVYEIEKKAEWGAEVEQPDSKLSSSDSAEPTRVRFGGGTRVTTGPLPPLSSPVVANPSAAPSSSPSSSSPAPQKVDAASTADSALSFVASSVASTADSAALPKSSTPSRAATAVASRFATGVDAANSLAFVDEKPTVNVATTVSTRVPVVGKTTLAAACLRPSPLEAKQSPSRSPTASTESLRSNENAVGSVAESVCASTVGSAQKQALVALPNTPSPPRVVDAEKSFGFLEEESQAPAKTETGLECKAQLEQFGRVSPLNETTPTKRKRSPSSSHSWSLSTAFQVFVRVTDQTLTVSVRPGAPVAALLSDVAARTGMESTDFFLLSGGKVLRSDATIADYDLASSSQLFVCERLVGGAGQGVKSPRIEITEKNWSELAGEEAEWRADQEDRYCEGWGDGCGGEHGDEDDNENMDGVDYSYDSSEEDEDARAGCQKEPSTIKQRMAALREKNKLLREENEKVKKGNRNYFAENTRLKKAKKDLEKEYERLKNAKCSCTARKSKAKPAPSNQKTSDGRHARLRAGRKEVDAVDVDPHEAEYLALWHDRPIEEVFAPSAFEEATRDLYVVDCDRASPLPTANPTANPFSSPAVLFRIDPACAGRKKSVYAAAKDVEPICFKRQFPRYVGGVLFSSFLEVIANCDRWQWDLFTVSEQYLPKLLTGEGVVTWAANPNSSALLRCSHSVIHRLYRIVTSVNDIISSRLIQRGIPRDEACRPRLLVQIIRTSETPSYHSKTPTGISRNGSLLYIVEGSGNPSKRGFGGAATDENGAAQRGSSHETTAVLMVPATSLVARRHLAEMNRFTVFLAQDRRLLRTNHHSTHPIRENRLVKAAEERLEPAKRAAGLSKAESDLAATQAKAWSERFEELETYTLTMGRDPPEQVGQVIALEDVWAAARKSLSPPKAFCKLYIQEGTDAKSGKWAASKGKLGEEAIDYYLVCCDCCSVTSGSMPPSNKDAFDIRHRPIGLGCPEYTSPTRAFLLRKSSASQKQLETIFRELQDMSIVEPLSGVRVFNPVLVWYSQVTSDLANHDAIRTTLAEYLISLPPDHAYHHLLGRLLKTNDLKLAATLRFLFEPVKTERFRIPTENGQTTTDQGIAAACLNDVVRFAYSRKSGNSKKGPSAGSTIPEELFWPSPYNFDEGAWEEHDDEEGEDEEEEDEAEEDDDYSRSND